MKTTWALGIGLAVLWVGSLLLSGPAQAQVICGTLAECRTLEAQTQARLGQIQTRIRELEGSTPVALGDIVRDWSGRVRHMNQYDAERYCREQGTWLPTARELAMYSQSLGARGIRETAHSGVAISAEAVRTEIAQMRGDGYYPIYTANNAGQTVVDFYFNYSGYQRPAGDLGNYWFWSSSVHPDVSDNAYVLVGYGGDFLYFYDRSYDYDGVAVRCVRSQRD